MKTLIISCGFIAVTNDMGGAIEKLIETYLIENDKTFKDDITLYSVKTDFNKNKKERNFEKTEIRVIDKTGIIYKLRELINFAIFKITKKYTGNIYLKEIIKDLKKRNELLDGYDCIIVENRGKFIPVLKKLTNSKLILHVHNDYLNINTESAKEILENCDKVWCVSKYICNRVKEISKVDKEKKKVELLYNGIDLQNFKKEVSDEEKQILRKKYGLNEKEKIILYIGRLMPLKGVKELLLAFKKLSEERQDVSLLIVGGTIQMKKNKDRFVLDLKKIANTINNKVIFTGNLEYKKLYEVYSLADVQVVPTKGEEAFGLIVVEGMSYLLPLITTNSGGIPELLPNDYELMIDKEGDLVQELYEKMKYFLNNSDSLNYLTESYSEKIEEFNKENYTKNFYVLMNKLEEME